MDPWNTAALMEQSDDLLAVDSGATQHTLDNCSATFPVRRAGNVSSRGVPSRHNRLLTYVDWMTHQSSLSNVSRSAAAIRRIASGA